jgi:hypothetical protein
MKNYNIEKNIYSKDGRLLLAAGQEITESTLHRLKSIDYSKASKIILSNGTVEKQVKNLLKCGKKWYNERKTLGVKNAGRTSGNGKR